MGKLERVLQVGDLANIPVTIAVYLAGAGWLYNWAESQKMSTHWEVVLVGIVLLLGAGSVALQIVDRVRGPAIPATRQIDVNPAQTNIANPALRNIDQFYRIFDGPLLQETETGIRNQMNVNNPPDREGYLTRGLSMLILVSGYEYTWLNIFGSQLRALNQLNTRMLSYDEMRHFYEEGATGLPQLYETRTFEMWLAFFRNSTLIRDSGDRLEITVRGREFLRYLVQAGYDQAAKLG
jgi:hypothetical protein